MGEQITGGNRTSKSFETGTNWKTKRLDRLVEAVSGGDYGGWDEHQDADHAQEGDDNENPTDEEDEYRDAMNEDIPEEDENFHYDQFKPSQLSPKVFNNSHLTKSSSMKPNSSLLQVQGSSFVNSNK